MSEQEGQPMGSLACLTCKKRLAYRQGNCLACYNRHSRNVRAAKTTWTKLEKKGLALRAENLGENWKFGRFEPGP